MWERLCSAGRGRMAGEGDVGEAVLCWQGEDGW
jgi:hypothetical protein